MPNFSGIWTVTQQMQARGQGIWTGIPLAIGDAYQGGFYAGQIGVSSVATHYIIVGPVSTAQTNVIWKTSNTSDLGATSVINGPANSASMNDAAHPAAQFCEDLTVGGFSDWYLPAKNELDVCYFNLKPSTVSNSTSFGINANAVPARASNYTAGNPAQTSATDFQTGNAEAFLELNYWSSTEFSYAAAWFQKFETGYQYSIGSKGNTRRVRAIRRVAV